MRVWNSHISVEGPQKKDRETAYPSIERPIFYIDMHQGLGGPYHGTRQLIWSLVPGVLERSPELVQRFAAVFRSIVPESADELNIRRTLTTHADSKERTRYFSHNRTPRIAHGVIDFLQAVSEPNVLGPFAVIFEHVQAADGLDLEFIRFLLRRARPERLLVVISSDETELPADVLESVKRYAIRVEAPSTGLSLTEAQQQLRQMPREERDALGRHYVQTDCTSDVWLERLAYEAAPADLRAQWHDERANRLLMGADLKFRKHGALLRHRERGSDAKEAGLAALMETMSFCANHGFYISSLELANQGIAMLEPDTDKQFELYHLINSKLAALMALGRIDEAEELCLEVQMNSTHYIMHWMVAYTLAMINTRYRSERDHKRAKAWSNVATALAGQFEDRKERAFRTVFSQNGLAFVEMHLGNSERALQLVSEGFELLNRELEPNEQLMHRSQLLYNRGQVYARQGRYHEAIDVYRQVIEVDPEYPEYHFDSGNFHNILGHHEEALACYRRAIECSVPFLEAHYNRGLLLKKLGRAEEALADFTYLIELDPDDADALTHRANLLLEQGEVELARHDVTHALTLKPQHEELLGLLGMVELVTERYQEAMEVFTRLLAVNPKIGEAWSNRALVRFQLGDCAGAITDLTEALAWTESATVLFNRAWAYQAAERWDDAVADYTEALTFPDADEADICYHRGACHLQAGRYDEGMVDWKRHLVLVQGESPYQADIAEKAPTLVG